MHTTLLYAATSHNVTPLSSIPSFLLPRLYATKVQSGESPRANRDAGTTQRQKIVLNEDDLIETFVRGSGPGGQCINKRSNCVDLRHIPTGIRVQCQQTRSLAQNRGIARKILLSKLDDQVNGNLSKNAVKAKKIAKAKKRQMKRAKEKYGTQASTAAVGEEAAGKNAEENEHEHEHEQDEVEDPYEEAVLEEVGCIRHHHGTKEPVVERTNIVSS
ncbi:hypothetical protein Unana1_05794 [Umbelopsis nana]